MKKLFVGIVSLLSLCINSSQAQNQKISEMPTYIGNPAPGWVPVVIGSTNRKVDASYFGYTKIDSLDVRVGTTYDTLYAYKNGTRMWYKLLRAGSGVDSSKVTSLQPGGVGYRILVKLNDSTGQIRDIIPGDNMTADTLTVPGAVILNSTGDGGSGDSTNITIRYPSSRGYRTFGKISSALLYSIPLIDSTGIMFHVLGDSLLAIRNRMTRLDSLLDFVPGTKTNGYVVKWNSTNSRYELGPDATGGGGGGTWGSITGTLSSQTDLQTALNTKATQNGDSYGGTMTLGTNDFNSLIFETDNAGRWGINAYGALYRVGGTITPTPGSSAIYADTVRGTFVSLQPSGAVTGFSGTSSSMSAKVGGTTIFTVNLISSSSTGLALDLSRTNSATSGNSIGGSFALYQTQSASSTNTASAVRSLVGYSVGTDSSTVYGNLNGYYHNFNAEDNYFSDFKTPATYQPFTNARGSNHFNTTSGYSAFGLGKSTLATSRVDILGPAGYNQLRLRTSYTPTGTADTNGNTGDWAWDADYIYVKTAAGWKRAALSTF